MTGVKRGERKDEKEGERREEGREGRPGKVKDEVRRRAEGGGVESGTRRVKRRW